MWNAPASAAWTCGSIAARDARDRAAVLVHLTEADMRGDAELGQARGELLGQQGADQGAAEGAAHRAQEQQAAGGGADVGAVGGVLHADQALGITMPMPKPSTDW